MEKIKLKFREFKEIFFEREAFAKVPKNLKVTIGKLYFFQILNSFSSELPSLLLATATAVIISNKIIALVLIVISILLNSVKKSIMAAGSETNELRESFLVEYFATIGNLMLSFTRNKVEKTDENGNKKLLSNTAIVDIIKNRFNIKFVIIDQAFENIISIILFFLTFGGLIKLLSSQVTDIKFYYMVIILSIILKSYIYSKQIKRLEKKYDNMIAIRRKVADAKRDLVEVEPMSNHHIRFMIDKLMKFQNESLEYNQKDTKERNKNTVLISFINSIAVIAVVLKISFEGGIDSLTAIKFANIITLSQLFSNILASVESCVRNYYLQKDNMSYYRKYQRDYLEVLDVYKIYANDIEVSYTGDIFVVEPFEYTYSNSNFTLKCEKYIKLQRGVLTHLKGESGAGKSTLVKILSGEIKVDKNQNENLSTVKYFNDDSKLGSGNVFEEITLELDDKNVDFERLSEIIEGIKLKKKFKTVDTMKRVLAAQLSNGMTQRVLLARTLYNLGESDLVVIDEPIGSLDEKTARKVMEFIKEFCNKDKKRFIIVCTHQYNIIKELIEETYEIIPVTPTLSELK